MRWATVNGAGSPVWPAFGVALAALIIGGKKLWPAIFVGRLLAGALSGSSQPLWAELFIAGSNAVGSLVAVGFLTCKGEVVAPLNTVRGMARFLVLGAGLGPLVSALGVAFGIASSAGMGMAEGVKLYFGLWTANFVGGAIVGAIILSWWSHRQPVDLRTWLKFCALMVLLAVGSYTAFAFAPAGSTSSWYVLPILVVIALSFDIRGSSVALFVVASIAIWLTGAGLGPFVAAGDVQPLSALLQFLAVVTISIFMLAVAADERRGTVKLEHQKRALEKSEELARARAEELQVVLDAVPAAILVARDPECHEVYGNPRARELLGLADAPENLGAASSASYPLEDFQIVADSGKALSLQKRPLYRAAHGEVVGPGEQLTRLPDGSERTVFGSAVPLYSSSGDVRGAVSTFVDITDRKEAEKRERLLSREVDHRAKNLLAVVQAAMQLTRADDIAGFRRALGGRIDSLARVHSLLTANRWQGAELKQLIEDELLAYGTAGSHSVKISGVPCALQPTQAQSMAMLFHELATNCAKYGSLSVLTGSLEVSWSLDCEAGGKFLNLCWSETGGPKPRDPSKKGFGLSLIDATVTGQLGGTMDLTWRDAGLHLSIRVPLGEAPEKIPVLEDSALESADVIAFESDRAKVLVLEDEPLIALQMKQLLSNHNCDVLGPIATTADAFDLLAKTRPHAAIIDINLGDEKSTPVADALKLAGIPFVFCTGYGDDAGLPERLHDVPRLAKPLREPELVHEIERLLHRM